jgi:hypothetical protein
MARIVNTDNFGGDYPDEKFLLWPMPRQSAQCIADVLNRDSGERASRFYKVVENDYVLQPGFEP